MKNSLIILGFFSLGVIVGFTKVAPSSLLQIDYSHYALYVLMFLVGVGIGADPQALQSLAKLNFRILLIPITTIVGTFLGILLLSLVLHSYKLNEMLAVGAGFGYYSLSSIIISDLHSKDLGVVALLSNVTREIITLLLAPIFALYFGKLAPICSGGATSMDTTLPIISTASGKEYALLALIHGIVLTIIVPFLVTLLIS